MRTTRIGIRREDKNEWERRVPLVPADLVNLRQQDGLDFFAQPSSIRAFSDDEYRDAGIEVDEDLDAASVVFAVKEIPIDLLSADTTYVCFSHVIKGQPFNMPTLARIMELGCSLLDYETITDDDGRRLIFFGVHAGYAGMIEGAWCLDRRLETSGRPSPFQSVRHAWEYRDLRQAKQHLKQIGERLRQQDYESGPLIVGLAGYGNVSSGCQEILGCLGAVEVNVADLPGLANGQIPAPAPLLVAIFKEEHMVEAVAPDSGVFALQDYYDHPEKYRGCFDRHLPHLDMLVNTTYWDARYPRLVTRDWAKESYGSGRQPRLQVIADISCDLEGSIELTVRATQPDAPCFTYDPENDSIEMGCGGRGPVVMAVDNLPCELPRESSEYFSRVLRDMVPSIGRADWRADLDALELPSYLERALIVHKGELTPAYEYLSDHLKTTT
jgi:alpha-aminoadipic semialdehyde synthase